MIEMMEVMDIIKEQLSLDGLTGDSLKVEEHQNGFVLGLRDDQGTEFTF